MVEATYSYHRKAVIAVSEAEPFSPLTTRYLFVMPPTVAGVSGYLFGSQIDLLIILCCFMGIEWLTALLISLAGIRHPSLSVKGVSIKIGMFCMIALANLMDKALGSDVPILGVVTLWGLVAYEGTRILDHLAEMGLPIPARLIASLAQLKERQDDIQRKQ